MGAFLASYWLAGGLLSLAAGVAAVALATVLILRLPANYLSHTRPPVSRAQTLVRHRVGAGLKNAGGVVLIGTGLLMSLPLVPGPGVLLIMAGLILADFRGKHALERRLIARRPVWWAINQVRHWGGRASLELPTAR